MRSIAWIGLLVIPLAAIAGDTAESWVRRQIPGVPFTAEMPEGGAVKSRGAAHYGPIKNGGEAWSEDLTLDDWPGGSWKNMIRLGYLRGWGEHDLILMPSRKTWGEPTHKKWQGWETIEYGYNDLKEDGQKTLQVHYIIEIQSKVYLELYLSCLEKDFPRYAPYYSRIRDSLLPAQSRKTTD